MAVNPQPVVRRLGLPPLELAASPYRQFNRHFEFTFDKVSNRYLFSKNHQKLNIYIYIKIQDPGTASTVATCYAHARKMGVKQVVAPVPSP
jgi:hypothetical protein